MVRFKEYVQIKPSIIALMFLEHAGNIVPGKLGLSATNVNVLVGNTLAFGLFEAAWSAVVGFPVPIASMCAGMVTLMVEVNRLSPNPLTGNQRPAYRR